MTTFNDRERGFEAKFANDEELKFKIMARRDRMLGEWVGAKLGLTGSELETYARSILKADLAEPGDEDVVRAVMADIDGKGVSLSPEDIRAKLNAFAAEAETALRAGA
ncbi:DUF1476 domain-containing protein [soil metagenome]